MNAGCWLETVWTSTLSCVRRWKPCRTGLFCSGTDSYISSKLLEEKTSAKHPGTFAWELQKFFDRVFWRLFDSRSFFSMCQKHLSSILSAAWTAAWTLIGHCRYSLDEFGTARRTAIVRGFIDALTRGGMCTISLMFCFEWKACQHFGVSRFFESRQLTKTKSHGTRAL